MVHYPNEVTIRIGSYGRDSEGGQDVVFAPMTLSQASYLMMLCEETDEVLDDSLTQAEAAALIVRLEDVTGRGPGHRPKLA
jgi:hypothetical protein